jgi:hypothetical protein
MLADEPGGGNLLNEQLVGLTTTYASGEMDVLVALLKPVGARSVDGTGASGLSSAERIVACWCHAGTLFKIIHPVVQPTELKALAEQYSGDSISAAFTNEMEFRADIASPRSISAEALLIWGLAYSCDALVHGMIPAVARKLLTELVVQEIDGISFPQGLLIDGKWLHPNTTNSFLAYPIGGLVEAITGTDVGRWSEIELQREILSQCLGSPGGDAGGLQAWRMVLHVMMIAAVPSEFEGMLVAAIERSLATTADVVLTDEPHTTKSGAVARLVSDSVVRTDILTKKSAVHFLGFVRYKDPIGSTHETGYCAHFDLELGAFVMHSYEGYNCTKTKKA